MLLTVTPNACIERTVLIPGFAAGESYRVDAENLRVNVGGKGVNAARVAAGLGVTVKALLWANSRQCAWMAHQLESEGVAHELIETEAETRTCINVVSGDGRKTEIVEAGHPLSIADGARLLDRFMRLLNDASLVALCGSYPPRPATAQAEGASPLDLHLASLCRHAEEAGKRVILDAKGIPFELALRHTRPWCIKPNIEEAAQLLRRAIRTQRDEHAALDHLLSLGAQRVVLSCGSRGCYFASAQRRHFFHSPQVREVSPVGSGDSLVGAFAARLLQGADEAEALRWGVAAGAANAAQLRPAFCTMDEIEAMLPAVRIEEL